MLRYVDKKLLVIMLVTIFSRVMLLGLYPGGVHADEAFAGYEAFSMLRYGADSWGYHNPVYLETWGSGMSALESYLMIPFIAIGGLNTLTIRIPQALLGIITVPLFFFFLKKITPKKEIAYWGSFLLAISPWHIMMSRYAMDCNMAPVFILLGIFFAIHGLENEKYLLLSALFWGISLYAYALNWIFVPVFLLLCFGYCMMYKKMRISGYTIGAAVILFICALPLLLFVAVNTELIPEIRTKMITIPKLISYRGNEVNFRNVSYHFAKLIKLLITQNDNLIWNTIKGFGIYYLFSTPFMVYGFLILCKKSIQNVKAKRFGYEAIIIFWVLVGIFVALIQGVGINRNNCMHLSLFVLLAVGLNTVCMKIGKRIENVLLVLYMISFLLFEVCYFTNYQDSISDRQFAGAGKAIAYALELSEQRDGETIYVKGGLRHSQILFYTAYPTDEYRNSVNWHKSEDNREVIIDSFGVFSWEDKTPEFKDNSIYIILYDVVDNYKKMGYSVMNFETCAVAY